MNFSPFRNELAPSFNIIYMYCLLLDIAAVRTYHHLKVARFQDVIQR